MNPLSYGGAPFALYFVGAFSLGKSTILYFELLSIPGKSPSSVFKFTTLRFRRREDVENCFEKFVNSPRSIFHFPRSPKDHAKDQQRSSQRPQVTTSFADDHGQRACLLIRWHQKRS